jgi:hypothetical protein
VKCTFRFPDSIKGNGKQYRRIGQFVATAGNRFPAPQASARFWWFAMSESFRRVEALLLAAQFQAMRELLAVLVNSASDREAGRKALLIAFTIDRKLIGTQRDLAKKMGVTEARASQMLKSIRANFPYKLNRLIDCV